MHEQRVLSFRRLRRSALFRTLPDEGLITRLDRLDRSAGAAIIAFENVQSLLSVQLCIETFAHVAHDVFVHVSPQDSLKVLGHETAFDNKTRLAVQVATGSELSHQVLQHVVRRPVHTGKPVPG